MTEDKKTSDINEVEVNLEFGEGENKVLLPVKIGDLHSVLGRLMTINEATVSYTKNILPAQYKSETPFFSLKVNLGEAWNCVPKALLADPTIGPALWKQEMKAMNSKLGNAARHVYRSTLSAAAFVNKKYGLNETAALEKELQEFGGSGSYDPFGVVEKKDK